MTRISAAKRLLNLYSKNESLHEEVRQILSVIYPPTTNPGYIPMTYSKNLGVAKYIAAGRYLTASNAFTWYELSILSLQIEFISMCMRVYGPKVIDTTKFVHVDGGIGYNVLLLCKLFPMCSFQVWSTAPMDMAVHKYMGDHTWNLQIYAREFTIGEAAKYIGSKVILLSYFKAKDIIVYNNEAYVRSADAALTTQKQIVDIIKPMASMVRYVRPYGSIAMDNLKYFKGINSIVAYIPLTITHTYIYFFNPSMISYDPHEYDQQCMFIRGQLRPLQFSDEEFNKFIWLENGVVRTHIYDNLPVKRLATRSYDSWRLLRTLFHTFITLYEIRFIGYRPLPVNFDNLEDSVLVSHTYAMSDKELAEFPTWLDKKLDLIEGIYKSTFTVMEGHSRGLTLEKIDNANVFYSPVI